MIVTTYCALALQVVLILGDKQIQVPTNEADHGILRIRLYMLPLWFLAGGARLRPQLSVAALSSREPGEARVSRGEPWVPGSLKSADATLLPGG